VTAAVPAQPLGLSGRERRWLWVTDVPFLACAMAALAWLPAQRPMNPLVCLALVAGFAVACEVRIPLSDGDAPAVQLFFVPMLFLAPLNFVPLMVLTVCSPAWYSPTRCDLKRLGVHPIGELIHRALLTVARHAISPTPRHAWRSSMPGRGSPTRPPVPPPGSIPSFSVAYSRAGATGQPATRVEIHPPRGERALSKPALARARAKNCAQPVGLRTAQQQRQQPSSGSLDLLGGCDHRENPSFRLREGRPPIRLAATSPSSSSNRKRAGV
jgi:hypothetical protein